MDWFQILRFLWKHPDKYFHLPFWNFQKSKIKLKNPKVFENNIQYFQTQICSIQRQNTTINILYLIIHEGLKNLHNLFQHDLKKRGVRIFLWFYVFLKRPPEIGKILKLVQEVFKDKIFRKQTPPPIVNILILN